jgi:hypothetical protein
MEGACSPVVHDREATGEGGGVGGGGGLGGGRELRSQTRSLTDVHGENSINPVGL